MIDRTRCILLLLLPLACPANGHAAPIQEGGRETQQDAWGIVTNQAVTVAGHEFCKYFIAEWRDKPGSERYTLAIGERPSARWGSQVWVEFAQRRVFQLQLPPARAGLQALAASAADSVYESILDIERQRQLVHDADLARDEF
ncbi:MAG: CsgE family curli-type amyloid fiber assembly protein [Janthinobacterium lividum]